MSKVPSPDPESPQNIDNFTLRELKDRTGLLDPPKGAWRARDLGVSIEAARRGVWSRILPTDQAKNWRTYPLPRDKDDLYKLACYSVAGRGPGKCYLRRCRRKWEMACKQRKTVDLDHKVEQSHEVLKQLKEKRKETNEAVKAFKEGLARQLEENRATLAELYDLAGSGFKKIMAAFVAGEAINEKEVTPAEFTAAAGKVFGQVAKLGTPTTEDAKDEAKEVFWQEAAKEMQEKLDMMKDAPVRVKGPEEDQ